MAGFTSETASLTLNQHANKLREQVFLGAPFSKRILVSKKKSYDSGERIIRPIVEAQNSSVENFSGSDSADNSVGREFGNLAFDWRQFWGIVYYEKSEIIKNKGAMGKVKLVQSRVKNLRMTLSQHLEELLLGNKNNTDAKALHGLKAIVGTKNNNIGGVTPEDRAGQTQANTWWNPRHFSKTTAPAYKDFMEVITKISRGGTDKPTLILSRPDKYVAVDSLMQGLQRYASKEMRNAGFDHIMIHGIPYIYVDDDMGSNAGLGVEDVYFLNENYLEMVCHSDDWMNAEPFDRKEQKAVWESIVTCSGQFICDRRRSQAKLSYSM